MYKLLLFILCVSGLSAQPVTVINRPVAGGSGGGGVSFSAGAGVPIINCIAGQAIYLDSSSADWWVCDSSNHWKKMLTVNPNESLTITGLIGDAPTAPTTNVMALYYDRNDHRVHSVDDTNLNVGYIGANLGVVTLSFPGPSVLSLKNTVNSNAMTIGVGSTRNAIGFTNGIRFLCEASATIDNQNGPTCFEIFDNVNAVNHFSVQAASTGANPLLGCSGSDTNVGCEIGVQGTGFLEVNNGATGNFRDAKLRSVFGSGTVHGGTGTPVASATTTALASDGDVVHITGVTNITTLNTCDATNSGRRVTLIFDGVLTFTDGNNLKLAGNFVTTADDTISLVCDASNWYETSRSVN